MSTSLRWAQGAPPVLDVLSKYASARLGRAPRIHQPRPAPRFGRGEKSGLVLALLAAYKRWISPLLPSACRFHPTCSEYMAEAVRRHGALQGIWMGLRRLARCHPFSSGGLDPVR